MNPNAATNVIWHDLECGSYRADLPLWLELAQECDAPLLDVGAGTGRVALRLAHAGHTVIALDLDQELCRALDDRARGLSVRSVCADARTFELSERELPLCLAPMQTLQLLGGSSQRTAFLRTAHAHLRPGGLLACAIVTELEPYDSSSGPAPRPDVALHGNTRYLSHPVGVRVLDERIVIERIRETVTIDELEPAVPGTRDDQPQQAREHSTIELDRVSVDQLESEALSVGFKPEPVREIPPTDDHVGSQVVMLRA